MMLFVNIMILNMEETILLEFLIVENIRNFVIGCFVQIQQF